MTEKPKSALSELELHVKNRPELHPLPLLMQPMIRGDDVGDYERWYDEMRGWLYQLEGKTQELSLSIAGKELSLRKLLENRPVFVSAKYGKLVEEKGAKEALRLYSLDMDKWCWKFEREFEGLREVMGK